MPSPVRRLHWSRRAAVGVGGRWCGAAGGVVGVGGLGSVSRFSVSGSVPGHRKGAVTVVRLCERSCDRRGVGTRSVVVVNVG